jgi:hypothetical protein
MAASVVNPHKKRKGKEMRKAIRTSALIILLASSAHAGIMGNDSPAPPPPAQPGYMPNESPTPSQPTSAVDETAANGEMPNLAPDGLTQVAWELLAVLPSLL